MDILTPAERSERMSRVRTKNTAIELAVRRLVRQLGYGYRLHRKDLPGKPDLVFVSRRKVLFVHGCFWHMHDGCKLAKLPTSREQYWIDKLTRNRARDSEVQVSLRREGWTPMVVWGCELRDEPVLEQRLRSFLDD